MKVRVTKIIEERFFDYAIENGIYNLAENQKGYESSDGEYVLRGDLDYKGKQIEHIVVVNNADEEKKKLNNLFMSLKAKLLSHLKDEGLFN